MTLEMKDKESRAAAVASIERYVRENFDDLKIGNIQAAALLHFFLEEIGPSLYNQAVADVQQRLLVRVSELDIEHHEDEFGYWPRQARQARR